MITCEEFAEHVTAYLEGTLPISERTSMWLHRLVCGHCRRYLRQMKLVVDLMGDVPEATPADGPSEATKNELLARFRDKTGE